MTIRTGVFGNRSNDNRALVPAGALAVTVVGEPTTLADAAALDTQPVSVSVPVVLVICTWPVPATAAVPAGTVRSTWTGIRRPAASVHTSVTSRFSPSAAQVRVLTRCPPRV